VRQGAAPEGRERFHRRQKEGRPLSAIGRGAKSSSYRGEEQGMAPASAAGPLSM
jgi:hypothetical protein